MVIVAVEMTAAVMIFVLVMTVVVITTMVMAVVQEVMMNQIHHQAPSACSMISHGQQMQMDQ